MTRLRKAYKAVFGEEEIAYLSYRLVGGRVALWSTAVLPAYRDHGVAGELIAKSLDDIRASGKKVTVICPVVRMVIDHYPQYEDLVDKEPRGCGSGAPPDLVDAVVSESHPYYRSK
jgi:predicted GNAT family acetyltransferase